TVVDYEQTEDGALVRLADGSTEEAPLVIAADGLNSVARTKLIGDDVVSSSYVAYRAAVPIEQVRDNGVAENDVTVYIGPRCHFVRDALRGGEMFNQVVVFESPKALAGQEDWGTPDELDAAFEATCDPVRKGIPLMWRDRWWRMFDRDPVDTWVHGRIVLLGDAAHPPLQYMAQGAIMAIEDGWVLARHYARLAEAAPGGTRPPGGGRAASSAAAAPRTRRCSTWPRARSWPSRTAGSSPGTTPGWPRPPRRAPAPRGRRRSPPTRRSGWSTAAASRPPPARGANCGTWTVSPGSGATRSCGPGTPPPPTPPTGCPARPPCLPPRSRPCSSRSRSPRPSPRSPGEEPWRRPAAAGRRPSTHRCPRAATRRRPRPLQGCGRRSCRAGGGVVMPVPAGAVPPGGRFR